MFAFVSTFHCNESQVKSCTCLMSSQMLVITGRKPTTQIPKRVRNTGRGHINSCGHRCGQIAAGQSVFYSADEWRHLWNADTSHHYSTTIIATVPCSLKDAFEKKDICYFLSLPAPLRRVSFCLLSLSLRGASFVLRSIAWSRSQNTTLLLPCFL